MSNNEHRTLSRVSSEETTNEDAEVFLRNKVHRDQRGKAEERWGHYTAMTRVHVVLIPLGDSWVLSDAPDMPTPCVPFILPAGLCLRLWGPEGLHLTGPFLLEVALSGTLHALRCAM